MVKLSSAWFCLIAAATLPSFAADMPGMAGMPDMPAMAKKPRAQVAASAAFDASGRLWVISSEDGHLVLRSSTDRGASFSPAQRVVAADEAVAAEGELRPEIAIAPGGNIYLAWTSPLAVRLAGHVRFARSRDGGKSFEPPITVNDDLQPITHRFQTLYVDPRGRIFLVWIDKRDLEAAKRGNEAYRGAAIYYAVSEDQGASFGANVRAAAHSCECCRIAMAGDSDGVPVALWRHVFADGARDHGMMRLTGADDGSEPPRATNDGWLVNACPHHGPDLSISADGTRHLVWFDTVAGEGALFYQAVDKGGRVLVPQRRLGGTGAAHPAVLARGSRVFLAWKSFDGDKTLVQVQQSEDGGRSWSPARIAASADGASDHPRLIADKARVYLSWAAAAEGYRLIDLGAHGDAGP